MFSRRKKKKKRCFTDNIISSTLEIIEEEDEEGEDDSASDTDEEPLIDEAIKNDDDITASDETPQMTGDEDANVLLKEKKAKQLQKLEVLAEKFGIDVPESTFIDMNYMKEIAKLKNAFQGLILADVYLKRDGELIAAFMNMYQEVKFGVTKMFALQLERIVHRFYKAREEPDYFTETDEILSQKGFDEIIDFEKTLKLHQEKDVSE